MNEMIDISHICLSNVRYVEGCLFTFHDSLTCIAQIKAMLAVAQTHRDSKAARDVPKSKIYKSGAGTHRNPKYNKAARRRAALQKHEVVPKFKEVLAVAVVHPHSTVNDEQTSGTRFLIEVFV